MRWRHPACSFYTWRLEARYIWMYLHRIDGTRRCKKYVNFESDSKIRPKFFNLSMFPSVSNVKCLLWLKNIQPYCIKHSIEGEPSYQPEVKMKDLWICNYHWYSINLFISKQSRLKEHVDDLIRVFIRKRKRLRSYLTLSIRLNSWQTWYFICIDHKFYSQLIRLIFSINSTCSNSLVNKLNHSLASQPLYYCDLP